LAEELQALAGERVSSSLPGEHRAAAVVEFNEAVGELDQSAGIEVPYPYLCYRVHKGRDASPRIQPAFHARPGSGIH